MSVSRLCSRIAFVLVAAALALGGCKEVEAESETGYEPSKLESVGQGQRVTFTAEGARRVGLRTEAVASRGRRLLVPYSALLYDAQGKTYVYISPRRLRYLRRQVEVDRIDADRVFLSSGPPAGTRVVTTGATEVYGTELEVPSH
jgi:multidrug efflux pump subunit AcrA (membrane-fusion protein)